MADLVTAMQAYVKTAAGTSKQLNAEELCQMNDKACGKLAKDTMSECGNSVDASVFPALKEKGKKHMVLTPEKCEEFVNRCAHEFCKKKDPKIAATDDKVKQKAAAIKEKIIKTAPKTVGTKTANTTVTDRMTDTSKYTGAHAQRFDDSGKGKGMEGRKDLHDNKGYVGQYKGEGTYDKKK